MVVRVINAEEDFDGFYDCECANVYSDNMGGFFLSCGRSGKKDWTRKLRSGDEIYYMNDSGKTIHSDCRMLKSKQS